MVEAPSGQIHEAGDLVDRGEDRRREERAAVATPKYAGDAGFSGSVARNAVSTYFCVGD